MHVNRQYVLANRPVGPIQETDLAYRESPVPVPGPEEVLVKTAYISLDPSMKGQMEARTDYTAPQALGEVMRARAVGTIIQSSNPRHPVGAQVFGFFGMQDFAVTDGRRIPFHQYSVPVDPEVALGLLGGTGMTAYFGMLDIGRPRRGDTVVVSGAAGATGSIAGQLARLRGARVIGIAGTAEKCSVLREELGFDEALNYREDNLSEGLDAMCPHGIDVFFDNVGGEILDLCLARLAQRARVVICGGISRYNATTLPPGPVNYFNLVYRRARMEGFILSDYSARFDEARTALQSWHASGVVRQRSTVVRGFDKLPNALVRLFDGANTGKMMVRTD
ncbi:MAG: NADP-dependent oxidoreductase [Pseudomonadales bacterium]|nr:NADP-dependent oxidoreductase [Pseudomonadales bacterium]MCP5186012.1 NADP-dependent oxidoreductase [Pseudomonadales bacterium]